MSAEARRCADAIRRIGGDAALLRDGVRHPLAACIQPRKSDDGAASAPMGVGAASLHTLYALPDAAGLLLDRGDSVECRGERYHVLAAETFFLRDEPLYRRAVLRRESGGE